MFVLKAARLFAVILIAFVVLTGGCQKKEKVVRVGIAGR